MRSAEVGKEVESECSLKLGQSDTNTGSRRFKPLTFSPDPVTLYLMSLWRDEGITRGSQTLARGPPPLTRCYK